MDGGHGSIGLEDIALRIEAIALLGWRTSLSEFGGHGSIGLEDIALRTEAMALLGWRT